MTEKAFTAIFHDLMKNIYQPALEEYVIRRVDQQMKLHRDHLWKEFAKQRNEETIQNLQKLLATLTGV